MFYIFSEKTLLQKVNNWDKITEKLGHKHLTIDLKTCLFFVRSERKEALLMIGNKINVLTLHDLLRVELGDSGRADGHLVGVEVIEVSLATDADYENEEQEKRTHPRSHLFHRHN